MFFMRPKYRSIRTRSQRHPKGLTAIGFSENSGTQDRHQLPHDRRITSNRGRSRPLGRCLSPVGPVPKHRVEDGEQLPGQRDERHLRWLSCCDNPFIYRLEDRVVPNAHHGGQVQRCAGCRAPGGDPPAAASEKRRTKIVERIDLESAEVLR